MSENKEIMVEYKITPDDYKSSKKELTKPLTIFFLVFSLSAIVILEILFILIYFKIGFTTEAIIIIVCFPLVNLFIIFVFPLLFKFKRLEELSLETISRYPNNKIIFNNYGIEASITNTTYDLKWQYFTKIVERKLFFYFYFPPMGTNIHVPKSVFTQEQIGKLRQLISDSMAKKKVKIKKK